MGTPPSFGRVGSRTVKVSNRYADGLIKAICFTENSLGGKLLSLYKANANFFITVIGVVWHIFTKKKEGAFSVVNS